MPPSTSADPSIRQSYARPLRYAGAGPTSRGLEVYCPHRTVHAVAAAAAPQQWTTEAVCSPGMLPSALSFHSHIARSATLPCTTTLSPCTYHSAPGLDRCCRISFGASPGSRQCRALPQVFGPTNPLTATPTPA